MNKKLVTFFILFMCLQLCAADDLITITKYLIVRPGNGTLQKKVIEEKYPINTEQLVLRYDRGVNVYRIEGAEKLTQVRRLLIGYGLSDFNFLNNLSNVEILILEFINASIDFDFLKNMPKLKILYISDSIFVKEEMNLINNKELKFLFLENISSEQQGGKYFHYKINNAPKSLEFIDLSNAWRIIKDEILLSGVEKVANVIISDAVGEAPITVNSQFLKDRPNIKLVENSDKILPEIYHRNKIYGLFTNLGDGY